MKNLIPQLAPVDFTKRYEFMRAIISELEKQIGYFKDEAARLDALPTPTNIDKAVSSDLKRQVLSLTNEVDVKRELCDEYVRRAKEGQDLEKAEIKEAKQSLDLYRATAQRHLKSHNEIPEENKHRLHKILQTYSPAFTIGQKVVFMNSLKSELLICTNIIRSSKLAAL